MCSADNELGQLAKTRLPDKKPEKLSPISTRLVAGVHACNAHDVVDIMYIATGISRTDKSKRQYPYLPYLNRRTLYTINDL